MELGGGCWLEIEKAEREKRRELVLQGPTIDAKIKDSGGLSIQVYDLSLLNYLEVSHCPSLRILQPELGKLLHLQSLILCRNGLVELPTTVGALRSLKVLDVSGNDLEIIPDELSQLAELNTLNVSCNKLQVLPGTLAGCLKLATLNCSHNRLTEIPQELFSPQLDLLSSIEATENEIIELSADVCNLVALKVLDLSKNKITEIPAELADCPKLKEINFRDNKLKDKRLEKMVNGCQTKSVLEYLRVGGRGKGKGKQELNDKDESKDKKKKMDRRQRKRDPQSEDAKDDLEELNKMVVRVLNVSESLGTLTVQVTTTVKDVRPYIVCCIIKGMNLKPGNALKRFLVAQTKLHDEICEKRTAATIATHDLSLIKGPLTYDGRPPKTLKITPLGRKETNAANLVRQLQFEAEEQRKLKKRQNVSGLHKYLHLLDGKENFPCVIDAEGHVISFPPITNSDKTKLTKSTKEILVEVTSSKSLQVCKDIMDALILKMAELNKFTFDQKEEVTLEMENEGSCPAMDACPQQESDNSPELIVQQIRVVDAQGNLKVVYPSKTDLNLENSILTVLR
ncbi:leucine-rich repeat-containing protein 47 [Polypterus senegalus]